MKKFWFMCIATLGLASISIADMTNGSATISRTDAESVSTYAGSNAAAFNPKHAFGSVIWGEFCAESGMPAIQSYEIELYSNETLLATTVVNNVGGFLDAGTTYALSWHILLKGTVDDYWTTTWVEPNPVVTLPPTHIVTKVNGLDAGTTAVQYDYDGGVLVTSWEEMPGVRFAKNVDTGAYYESLQAAVDAATDGQTVTLLSDLTTEEGINIASDKNVIVDLAGKTVSNWFWVNGTATIKNGTIATAAYKSGIEINVSEDFDGNGGNAFTPVLNLEDLTISSPRHAVRVDGGTVTIKNGTYTSLATGGTHHAVNISHDSADVTIEGGTFVGCGIGQDGDTAVAIRDDGQLTITGGEFMNETGNFTIGAWGGTLNITGGVFHKAVTDTLNMGGGDKGTSETGIAGGYFEDKPDTALLQVGKAAKTMTSGDYTGWYEIKDAVAMVGTEPYASLLDAVTAAKDNETITLLSDDAGAGIIVDKSITIDFAGFTYTVNEAPLAGSIGTATQCFQLLKDNTIVLKNGTIVADHEGVKMMVQNYSDLTLEGVILDATKGKNGITGEGSNKYVLSNNNGTTVLTGGTTIIAKAGGVAFDVCRYSSYPSVSVTVEDATIKGVIETSGTIGEGQSASLTLNGGDFKDATLDIQNNAEITKSDAVVLTLPAGMMWADGKPAEIIATIGKEPYASLAAAVDAATENATLKLAKDASGAGLFIATAMTIDFGGFTYTVTGPAVGSAGTVTQALHIEAAPGKPVTLKNGVVNSTCDDVLMLVQNYSDLTLDGMTLDATGDNGITTYTLSNNSGNTVLKNGTTLIAKDGKVAFDAYYWPTGGYTDGVSVKIADKTVVINGAIEYTNDSSELAKDFLAKASIIIPAGYEGAIAPEGYTWAKVGAVTKLVKTMVDNAELIPGVEVKLVQSAYTPETPVTMTGLPTGLSYSAKDVAIVGTPTKPGIYNAIVTVTFEDLGTFSVQVTFTVKNFPDLKVIPAGEGTGTVSGIGKMLEDGSYLKEYKANQKVTLTAKPDRNSVFIGWYTDAEGKQPLTVMEDHRTTKLVYTMTSADAVTLYAHFIPAENDTLGAFVIDGIDNAYPAGQALSLPVRVVSASIPTVTVKGLPKGLKFNAKTMMIEGTPNPTAAELSAGGTFALTVSAKNAGNTKPQVLKTADGEETVILTITNRNAHGFDAVDTPVKVTMDVVESVVGDKIVISLTNSIFTDGTLIGYRVSGLPAGMKWDAKTGTITGSPTKPGVYTITVSNKVGVSNFTFEVAPMMEIAATGAMVTIPSGEKVNVGALEDFYAVTFSGADVDVAPIAMVAEDYTVKASGLPKGLSVAYTAVDGFVLKGKTTTVTMTPVVATLTFTHKLTKASATAPLNITVTEPVAKTAEILWVAKTLEVYDWFSSEAVSTEIMVSIDSMKKMEGVATLYRDGKTVSVPFAYGKYDENGAYVAYYIKSSRTEEIVIMKESDAITLSINDIELFTTADIQTQTSFAQAYTVTGAKFTLDENNNDGIVVTICPTKMNVAKDGKVTMTATFDIVGDLGLELSFNGVTYTATGVVTTDNEAMLLGSLKRGGKVIEYLGLIIRDDGSVVTFEAVP